MGKPTGFKEFTRQTVPYRNAMDRLIDYKEIYTAPEDEALKTQGARCMDCGVPFCQSENGCPVYNLIPEWNDLVYHGRWEEALERLHKTNNFPEFTGRVCVLLPAKVLACLARLSHRSLSKISKTPSSTKASKMAGLLLSRHCRAVVKLLLL